MLCDKITFELGGRDLIGALRLFAVTEPIGRKESEFIARSCLGERAKSTLLWSRAGNTVYTFHLRTWKLSLGH